VRPYLYPYLKGAQKMQDHIKIYSMIHMRLDNMMLTLFFILFKIMKILYTILAIIFIYN